MLSLDAQVKVLANFINGKLIPFCIFIHEYSHYSAAKLLGLEVKKFVLHETTKNNKSRGYITLKPEFNEKGEHSNSFIIKNA